ncbi:MAG TPA: G5 domain-containing protein [Verrucomicrobiae bacterium]|nr:G5 domain-containing protein [Verrucomicrobiae bacterium]
MKASKPAAIITMVVAAGALMGVLLQGEMPAKTRAAETELIAMPGLPSDREAERYTGSFLETTTEGMLARLGVRVYPEDKVFSFPDPTMGIGSQLLVYRAQVVKITEAGTTRTVRTWAPTVEALAEEQHLELASKDKVTPARTMALVPNDEPVAISITRVAETELTLATAVPYTTQKKDDPNLDRGVTKVEQAGKNGVLKTTYLVRRETGADGKVREVSRTKLKAERTSEPVNEVIVRGTKVTRLDKGLGTFYRACGINRFTAAHKTLPKGTKVVVTNLANGKSIEVVIDDRGPFGENRVIDLSCDAFAAIASTSTGVISVVVEK